LRPVPDGEELNSTSGPEMSCLHNQGWLVDDWPLKNHGAPPVGGRFCTSRQLIIRRSLALSGSV